jgi:HEAT repeat protein
MPEPTPLAKKIAGLNELRADPEAPAAAPALRGALADRSHRVVAKAAELCGELGKAELLPDLLKAYERMFVNPLKKDPGCLGKTAIALALTRLGCQAIELYRQGIKYRQYEPVWGGQEDTAGQLRAVCAIGMVGCAPCSEAIASFADLLADPCKLARIGAARAIAALGRWEGAPLLRLKLLSGDPDAEVLGECCAALLSLTPDEGVELVIPLLSSTDADVRVQAALALGQSRRGQALEPLCSCWRTEREASVRGILLTCIGLLRSAESRELLLSLIRGPDSAAAADAIRALAPYGAAEELRQQVEQAVAETGSTRLRAVFEGEFKKRAAAN